VIDMKKFTKKW